MSVTSLHRPIYTVMQLNLTFCWALFTCINWTKIPFLEYLYLMVGGFSMSRDFDRFPSLSGWGLPAAAFCLGCSSGERWGLVLCSRPSHWTILGSFLYLYASHPETGRILETARLGPLETWMSLLDWGVVCHPEGLPSRHSIWVLLP